jgi:hypothetical protein
MSWSQELESRWQVVDPERSLISVGYGYLGANPSPGTNCNNVWTGDISNGTYLRHGVTTLCRRVVEGLQGFLFEIDEAEIVVQEADDPNAVVDLLDAEALTGKHG